VHAAKFDDFGRVLSSGECAINTWTGVRLPAHAPCAARARPGWAEGRGAGGASAHARGGAQGSDYTSSTGLTFDHNQGTYGPARARAPLPLSPSFPDDNGTQRGCAGA